MSWQLFATIFGSVFVAELGDKSQLAAILFAVREGVSRWAVFAASSAALLVATAAAVLAGKLVAGLVGEQVLRWVAGLVFIAVGVWTLVRH